MSILPNQYHVNLYISNPKKKERQEKKAKEKEKDRQRDSTGHFKFFKFLKDKILLKKYFIKKRKKGKIKKYT